MQIAGLKLTNFRSHLDTQFGFDRINVIRGLNGSGKSSIAYAIELALTGRCEVTDAAGKGADDLIHSSAKEAIVDLLIKADGWKHGPLTRRQLRSGQTTTIGPHTGRSAMAVIEAQLARIPVLSAVLNSHRFLEMDAKSQKALMADSLGSDPVEVDESIIADADRVSPNTVGKSIASAAEVDRVYDNFFKMRTLEKRELAGLGAITEPDIPEDAPSLKETREKLGRLRTEKDVLVQERGKRQREYQKASDEYFHAVQKLREVEAEVLESDELNRLEAIVKSRPKVVKLEEEINTLRGKISSTRESITRLNSPQASSCPTCGHALEVKDNSEVVKQLEANLIGAETTLEGKKAERAKLGDPDDAKRKIERHGQCSGAWATADGVVKKGAPAELDFAELDQQIAQLNERITTGEGIVETLAKLEGAKEQYERSKNQRDILTTKISALERLVEYFSDKGPLKAKLVGGKLPAFIERINAVLERFGFSCIFTLDPYHLSISTHGHSQGLSLHQLSESEQYRFSIAFQIALAEATGVGIVIADRADMLTAESRQLLTAELMESRLDQAFLLSTGEPMDEFPEIPGVAFFELENNNGRTTIRAQSSADEKKAYATR